MTSTSSKQRTIHCYARLAVSFALLAGIPACGNLDETDSDPPSVIALAAWDSSHLVAVRTYHKEPVIVALQSGAPVSELGSAKYYSDIEVINGGEYVCLHNQSIDFFVFNQLDGDRSISADLFTRMTASADRSTLAYAKTDLTSYTIGVLDMPDGTLRYSLPDLSINLPQTLSLSRDGNLMAFGQGGVTIAPTHAPAPGIPAVSTCVLAYSDSYHGGPLATAFSPVEDTLAVGKDDGGVNIFDVSHYPDCRRLQNIGSPDGNAARIGHLQFSPDGSVLAISVETAEPQITTAIMRGVLRLLDVKTGVTQRELPIYQWEMNVVEPVPARGPMPNITDLQWSEAGDRISVSTSDGPVQHWNVITGTLLWSARL